MSYSDVDLKPYFQFILIPDFGQKHVGIWSKLVRNMKCRSGETLRSLVKLSRNKSYIIRNTSYLGQKHIGFWSKLIRNMLDFGQTWSETRHVQVRNMLDFWSDIWRVLVKVDQKHVRFLVRNMSQFGQSLVIGIGISWTNPFLIRSTSYFGQNWSETHQIQVRSTHNFGQIHVKFVSLTSCSCHILVSDVVT